MLVNKLGNCKGKGNKYVEGHINKIQDTYKQEDIEMKIQEPSKGKQQIQNEEVLLYKSYKVESSKPKTPEPKFIQDKINNLEKYMKFMQLPVQTMPFLPPLHYKTLWPQGEQDKQHWNEITVVFLEKKHNTDITRKDFLIKMYTRGLPHEPYFITLILQGKIIVGPTKKLVTTYVVGDLALLD